jgi:hypothetical protein
MPIISNLPGSGPCTSRVSARKLAILTVIGVLALSALWIVRAYTLDLVNYVVLHACLHKAPAEIEPQRIQAAFAQAMSAAGSNREARRRHLERLFAISQKLEKVQQLSSQEALEVLDVLEQGR